MKRFIVATMIAAALVVGWAVTPGMAAESATADGQTVVLRGPQPAAQPAQPARANCPEGYYSNGNWCRPYSWRDVTTGENELQPLYPLPVLTR
jgi:hypothetical protein